MPFPWALPKSSAALVVLGSLRRCSATPFLCEPRRRIHFHLTRAKPARRLYAPLQHHRCCCSCRLLFVSICSAQQASTTAVPNLIRYSGTLKDAQGAAPSSTARRCHLRHLQAAGRRCGRLAGDAKRHARRQRSVQRNSGQHHQPRDCRMTCSRSRSSAGWACRSRDKPSRPACCW